MEAKGFFTSLFDYSFSSFIAPKIIKILYGIATVLIALYTLGFVLLAFQLSSAAGILTLLIFGPAFFLISMIWARVLLEILSAFFHIHGDVREIRGRTGGAPAAPSPELGSGRTEDVAMGASSAVEPPRAGQEPQPVSETGPGATGTAAPGPAPGTPKRYCENCGAERSPTARFCTSCGHE